MTNQEGRDEEVTNSIQTWSQIAKGRSLRAIYISQFSFFVAFLALPGFAAVGPGITIETMDGTIGTWDKIDWVDGSFTDNMTTNHIIGVPDSIRFLPDGQLNANEVWIGGVFHLQIDNVPTDDYLRLDASTFQQIFGSNLEHWGMAVVLFFDDDNWVTITRIRESGGGYMSHRRIGGVDTKQHLSVGQSADSQWRMHGIELTATDVNFYATPLTGPDTFSSNNWDQLMSEDLSTNSFPRPATYTGDVSLVVGKGYVGGLDAWDGPWDFVNPKSVGIDATRIIIGSVAEPGPEITDFGVADGTATVAFVSIDGTTNRLESTPDLINSNFSATGASVLGDGTGKVLTDPAGSPNSKSYRVTADE